MVRSLRGIDADKAAYLAREERALDDQWPITALAWLYRWCGRVGGASALSGLAAGAITRVGRRQGPVALAEAAMLTAVLARIMFVAFVDASTLSAAKSGVYLLPAVGFYGLFVILGTWVLVAVVRDRLPRPGGRGQDRTYNTSVSNRLGAAGDEVSFSPMRRRVATRVPMPTVDDSSVGSAAIVTRR